MTIEEAANLEKTAKSFRHFMPVEKETILAMCDTIRSSQSPWVDISPEETEKIIEWLKFARSKTHSYIPEMTGIIKRLEPKQ